MPLMEPFISSSHLTFFFRLLLLLSAAAAAADSLYLKLPLLHRNPRPSLSESLSADKRRLVSAALHPKLPVTSAAASGTGQYIVSIHLGTPPQRVLLVADTGSDLTWVSCSPCRGPTCSPRAAARFLPRRSSTFSPYHCFDPACRLVPRTPSPRCNHTRLHSACRYSYSYSDGSLTTGFFSRETTAFNTTAGELLTFRRLAFGCGFRNTGPSVSGPSFNGADGVLGLGRGPISFISQLGKKFGHRFSFCLMDYTLSPPPTSYLLIGSGGGRSGRGKLRYTPLLINPLSPTFYYIGIENALIENVKLPINPSVWSIDDLGNGGTVLDSGTTLSFLAKPAYRLILAAFERLVKLPRSADPNSGFDLCLNVSALEDVTPCLPRLSFRLAGGAVFSPPPRNYFIDAAEGVKCLALLPTASPAGSSVLGNLMQQGYTFEFDRERSRLGFTRHGCSVP